MASLAARSCLCLLAACGSPGLAVQHHGTFRRLEMHRIHECPMLQDGAGHMMLRLLRRILKWASAWRPFVAPFPWMTAVNAVAKAEQQQMPNDYSALFEALKDLLDGIPHPMLILVGEL